MLTSYFISYNPYLDTPIYTYIVKILGIEPIALLLLETGFAS